MAGSMRCEKNNSRQEAENSSAGHFQNKISISIRKAENIA